MNYILNIETSTSVCSVSISSGTGILALRESSVDRSHAAMLGVFIEEAMRETDLKFNDLSAVAVSRGPGSYTGLRIGVSMAKGICYASDLPLIAIDTLRIMTWKVIRSQLIESFNTYDEGNNGQNAHANNINIGELHLNPGSGRILLCPMIDARRMEVYMSIFDVKGNQIKNTSAEIITESAFSEFPEDNTILFFGDGADKCRNIAGRKNVLFFPGIYPSAEQMGELSHNSFLEKRFENTAYFEPFYLKDFITTKPKPKLL